MRKKKAKEPMVMGDTRGSGWKMDHVQSVAHITPLIIRSFFSARVYLGRQGAFD